MTTAIDKFVLGFGIFSIIISIMAAGANLAGFVYSLWCLLTDDNARHIGDYYIAGGIFTLFLYLAVISLVFSVLLVKGVKEENPRFLKLYFIYGCLLNLVCAVGVTIFGVWFQDGASSVAIVLPICSIYSLVLAAVLKTQVKFQINTNYDKYQLANNNQYLFTDIDDRSGNNYYLVI